MGRFSLSSSFLLLSLLLILNIGVLALPLSTKSRWMVDENGRRVKLACVNWVAHVDAVVAEGLSKQPVDAIARRINAMGFNCVRLTWPLDLATNGTLASLTVQESLRSNGLFETVAGFKANNPQFLNLTLINAYQEVVSSLGRNNLMVIVDNHLTKPGWCCSRTDGNGFFGDQYFKPEQWIEGWSRMAALFNGVDHVVGMSLRNELRGSRQNSNDWYKYMTKGAETVHAANPNVLVIVSGLSFDRNLSFLAEKALGVSFSKKLVYEMHWYAFSDSQAWVNGNPNDVCGTALNYMKTNGGFVLEQGYPLFISEFGIDQRGTDVNDNRYFSCFLGWAAEQDVDWALWALAGSYYVREGILGLEEVYGVLDFNWCGVRNSTYLGQIAAIQPPLQGPGFSEVTERKLLFHPFTGLCVQKRSVVEPLRLGPCNESEGWDYTPQKALKLKGTYFCLRADEVGQPVKLGLLCSDSKSKWSLISDSKMHLSAKPENGSSPVCLDVGADNSIVTSPCNCLAGDKSCDPERQWFKMVTSTRKSLAESKSKSLLPLKTIFDLAGRDFLRTMLGNFGN